MPNTYDIDNDRFYEPAYSGVRDPEEHGFVISTDVRSEIRELRDGILNFAPCEVLNAPFELQSNSRATKRILEYCDYHQRRGQDDSLYRELLWRWVSVNEPSQNTVALEQVKDLSIARRDLVRDHYQAVVVEFAKRFGGSTISIVDATGLQEPEGMAAWSGHLRPFLETNKTLCDDGLNIERTLLVPPGFALDHTNAELTSMIPFYGPKTGAKGMLGRIVSTEAKATLASRVDELAPPVNLIHSQVQSVIRIRKLCRSLNMLAAFEDIPRFQQILHSPSGNQSLIGMIDSTLNHSIFGGEFFLHLNQYFWTTRIVSSPIVIGVMSRWTQAVTSAASFDIGSWSEIEANA